MTGYASVSGGAEGLRWMMEVRSVNGRGLDLKVRTPSGWEAADALIKQTLRDKLVRGNVSVTLQVEREQQGSSYRLNEALVGDLNHMAEQIVRLTGHAVSLNNILSIRGVIEEADSSKDLSGEVAAALEVLKPDVVALAEKLVTARREEGNALASILAGQADSIETLVSKAEATAGDVPKALRERLLATIGELTAETDMPVPEERIAQEVTILAAKADIREELDRLAAHLDALRNLMAEGRGIGRRLDFLAQEFNREANTLCSKSSSIELTKIGLELKTVIDQLREQIQNIE
ncbi:MAG: YicC family protein [Alphaproteobacteria bacterium]|nr:YicC family protein [Alphaproteobacteria bacterium SS10]